MNDRGEFDWILWIGFGHDVRWKESWKKISQDFGTQLCWHSWFESGRGVLPYFRPNLTKIGYGRWEWCNCCASGEEVVDEDAGSLAMNSRRSSLSAEG